jgi:hypothetical protein
MNKLSRYNKFIVAVIGAVAQAVAEVYGSDPRVQIALAVLTALGVYKASNKC